MRLVPHRQPAEGKVITHEMYAAGHPPLAGLEVAAFSDEMPRHWQYVKEKSKTVQETFQVAPSRFEESQVVLVGGMVAFRETMRLLAEEAADDGQKMAPARAIRLLCLPSRVGIAKLAATSRCGRQTRAASIAGLAHSAGAPGASPPGAERSILQRAPQGAGRGLRRPAVRQSRANIDRGRATSRVVRSTVGRPGGGDHRRCRRAEAAAIPRWRESGIRDWITIRPAK